MLARLQSPKLLALGLPTVARGLSFLGALLMLRAGGPALRGEYAAVVALAEGVSRVVSRGYPEAIAHSTRNSGRSSVPVGAVLATATLAVVIAVPCLYFLFPDHQIVFLLGLVYATISSASLTLRYVGFARADYLRVGISDLVSPVSVLAYLVVGLLGGFADLGWLIMALAAGQLLGFGLLLPYLARAAHNEHLDLKLRRQSWMTGLMNFVSNRSDVLVLAFLAGPEATGVYSLAVVLSTMVKSLGVSAGQYALGVGGRSDEADRAELRSNLRLAIVGAVGSMLAGSVAISMLLDSHAGVAYASTGLLLAASIAMSQSSVIQQMLLIEGQSSAILRAQVAGAMVTLALIVPLVLLWGPLGPAVLTLTVYAWRWQMLSSTLRKLRSDSAQSTP